MPDDDFDTRKPDPVLQSSEGDEAVMLAERDSRKKWLGVAAGVGVGSAAIAAAMLFWGKNDQAAKGPASRSRQKSQKPIAVSGASDACAD